MSTFPRRLGRVVAVALLGLCALSLPGCGGGGYSGSYRGAGTLEVRNSPFPLSLEGIDSVEVSQPFGPVDVYFVELAPGNRDYISLIADRYDVDLNWSDGAIDSFFGIDIYSNLTTVVTGTN